VRTMTLGEIVTGRPLITVDPDATVTEAAERMADTYKGAILIVKGMRLLGIFTERDLLLRVVAAHKDPATTAMHHVMSSGLVVGFTEESYLTALQKMSRNKCRHLPVMDGNHLIGIVSCRELQALDISEFEREQAEREPAAAFI
jgi:CBS domain-containing protein